MIIQNTKLKFIFYFLVVLFFLFVTSLQLALASSEININYANVIQPVNKLIFGTNLGWTDFSLFEGGNIIASGNFEYLDDQSPNWCDQQGLSRNWHKFGNDIGNCGPDTTGKGVWELDSSIKYKGSYSQKIVVSDCNGCQRGIKQVIGIRPHTYEVSFYVKNEGISKINVQIGSWYPSWVDLAKKTISLTNEKDSNGWARYSFQFTSNMRSDHVNFIVYAEESGTIWLDELTMKDLTEPTVHFDENILPYWQQLNPTILRFPSGSWANVYHWKAGIGQSDALNFDNFMKIAEQRGNEVLIQVNYGCGTAEEAADWVEYTNGNTNTVYGALRAANGHPAPYNIKYWEVGNENHGDWECGYDPTLTDEQRAEKYAFGFAAFASAMKAKDPTIKVGGVADDWNFNIQLIDKAGSLIDFLCLHQYIPGWYENPESFTNEEIYNAAVAGVDNFYYGLYLRRSYIITPKLGQEAGDKIKFANTEWNIEHKNNMARTANLEGGIVVAESYIYMLKSKDMALSNIFYPIGFSSQSNYCLISNMVNPFLRPTGLAMKLFREHFGDYVLNTTSVSPTFDVTKKVGYVDTRQGVPDLVALASKSSDNSKLYLIVVNRHIRDSLNTTINIVNFNPDYSASVYTLNGPDVTSNNENGTNVFITPGTINNASRSFTYNFPAHSVTTFEFSGAALPDTTPPAAPTGLTVN